MRSLHHRDERYRDKVATVGRVMFDMRGNHYCP